MIIAYELGSSLYVNLTNRCSNFCTFCVRNNRDDVNGKDVLWLEREPTKEEILADIKKHDLSKYKELCFCGFGEPAYRIDDIVWVAREVKKESDIPIRLNTNGQANLIHGRDVTPEFQGAIDIVSVSLNAPTAEEYDQICHSKFGLEAYAGLIDFAKKCKPYVKTVKFSVVDVIGEEKVKACQKVADEAGIPLRVRAYIKD